MAHGRADSATRDLTHLGAPDCQKKGGEEIYLLLLNRFLDAFDAVNAAEAKLEVANMLAVQAGGSSPEIPFAERELKTSRRELRRAYRMFSEAGQF